MWVFLNCQFHWQLQNISQKQILGFGKFCVLYPLASCKAIDVCRPMLADMRSIWQHLLKHIKQMEQTLVALGQEPAGWRRTSDVWQACGSIPGPIQQQLPQGSKRLALHFRRLPRSTKLLSAMYSHMRKKFMCAGFRACILSGSCKCSHCAKQNDSALGLLEEWRPREPEKHPEAHRTSGKAEWSCHQAYVFHHGWLPQPWLCERIAGLQSRQLIREKLWCLSFLAQTSLRESCKLASICLAQQRPFCLINTFYFLGLVAEEGDRGWSRETSSNGSNKACVEQWHGFQVPNADRDSTAGAKLACHIMLLRAQLVLVEVCLQRQSPATLSKKGKPGALHMQWVCLPVSSWCTKQSYFHLLTDICKLQAEMLVFISASGALKRSKDALGQKFLDLLELEDHILAEEASLASHDEEAAVTLDWILF